LIVRPLLSFELIWAFQQRWNDPDLECSWDAICCYDLFSAPFWL